jgi:hypothetical protein
MTYKWDAVKARQAAKDRNHSDYEDGFMICSIHGKQPNVSGNVGCEECEACLLEQKAANQTDPDYLKFLEDQDCRGDIK